jgi:septal ring factor EnvC (AmiA/AmiB activator)
MTSVIDLYEKLRLAPDETARARIIAEAFEALENRYPHLDYLVTTRHLSETELKLTKEIEQVRLEVEQVRSELKATELKLTKEIEDVRLEVEQVRSELKATELKATELKLTKEIEQVRLEIVQASERTRSETLTAIAESKASLIKWSFLFWLSQMGAILLLLWRLFPNRGG